GTRGSAASDTPGKASPMAAAIARDQHLMCRLQARRGAQAMSAGHFRRCTRERPAALLISLASIVPSLSGLAALKRVSTSARNSFLSRVPSLSGSVRKEECLSLKTASPDHVLVAHPRCVPVATLPNVPTRIGKTIMGRHKGMFDNLHDGPVTCVGAWVSQHYSSQKSPLVKGARAQLPQPCHHRT